MGPRLKMAEWKNFYKNDFLKYEYYMKFKFSAKKKKQSLTGIQLYPFTHLLFKVDFELLE